MAVQKKFPALGRGLDALIETPAEVRTNGSSSISEIPLSQIHPNPNQPRREFDETALNELAVSISEIGIVQPITLRKESNGSYQIIAGERRWRASQRAGKDSIPAYIRTASDENVMEMALVENIQREDLNPIEVALAYQHLIEASNLTQDQLSQRVGKNRSTVTNSLRLLRLPAAIQVALQEREIDQGHARALLSLSTPTQQLRMFEEIRREKLSVRAVEAKVKHILEGGSVATSDGNRIHGSRQSLSHEYALLKDNLSRCFGTKVQMTCNDAGKGKITIPFASEEDLERIVELLDRINS